VWKDIGSTETTGRVKIASLVSALDGIIGYMGSEVTKGEQMRTFSKHL
jgi:hypothetical protein